MKRLHIHSTKRLGTIPYHKVERIKFTSHPNLYFFFFFFNLSSSLSGVLETQVVLFGNRVDELDAEIPEFLCQSLISCKFAWNDFIAICKVLSCYSLQTWVQSNITCRCCSLSTLRQSITMVFS